QAKKKGRTERHQILHGYARRRMRAKKIPLLSSEDRLQRNLAFARVQHFLGGAAAFDRTGADIAAGIDVDFDLESFVAAKIAVNASRIDGAQLHHGVAFSPRAPSCADDLPGLVEDQVRRIKEVGLPRLRLHWVKAQGRNCP